MKKIVFLLAGLLAVISYGCDFEILPPNKMVSPYLADLSAYVPKPLSGASPAKTVETPEFTGSAVWRRDIGVLLPDEKFEEGVAYSAEILLSPKQSFTFKGFSGSFSHRDANSLSQSVSASPDSAFVTINFKINDVKIGLVKGTRLKTFTMVPEISQLESSVTVVFNGEYIYNQKSVNPSNGSTSNSQGKTSCNITFSMPIKYFFPSNYSVSANISAGYLQGSYTLNTPFPALSPLDYETTELENFICDSYILPENGYAADRNYLEFKAFTRPVYSSTFNLPPYIYNGFPTSYDDYYSTFTSSPVPYNVVFRQTSRNFYIYKTVSVSFNPSTPIVGFNKVHEIVDRLDFDESSNTLTAYLKNYNALQKGLLFYVFIASEDGTPHTKFVSIGG